MSEVFSESETDRAVKPAIGVMVTGVSAIFFNGDTMRAIRYVKDVIEELEKAYNEKNR